MNPDLISSDNWEYLLSLVTRMRDPAGGVDVRERKWMLKKYASCFIGAEAVTWLAHNEPGVKDRAAAVELGVELQMAGLLSHVTRDHSFKDEQLFYRFTVDDARASTEHRRWSELIAPVFGDGDTDAAGFNPGPARLQRGNPLSDSVLNVIQSLHVTPLDAHNLKLLSNVHPPAWTSATPAPRYNLVVIGAGTAGLVTAAAAAGLGARVALVERSLMGGDCLNFGCVPSKALLACAKRVHQVRTADVFGVRVAGPVTVDFGAIMERMRRIRAEISWNDSAPRFAQQLGVDVFFGQATFTSATEVTVEGGPVLPFSRAVICTGARAAVPSIPGLLGTPYLTNETLFNLTALPATLLIVGAGVVACEMGQAFARFGSKVTILMRGTELLKREDPEAQQLLEASLIADGISIVRNVTFVSVAHSNGQFSVATSDATHVAEQLLCATGRAPNVDGLGLDVVGVRYSALGVEVNDMLQTSASHIYAAGDCCSALKFTHLADFQARLVLRNALFFGHAKASSLTVPWCTYTDPEVAHVGLYEEDQPGMIDVFRVDLSENDRSICEGVSGGFVKILTSKGTGQIVGATIVGPHAGDMVSEITLAIVNGITLSALASVIHPYPTAQDAVRRCGDHFNRTKLSPAVKIVFRKLFAARRW